MSNTVGALFFAKIQIAVEQMRQAGMQDAQIACVVCDIRDAALQEERLRIECVFKEHPPMIPTWVKMRDTLNDLFPRSSGE